MNRTLAFAPVPALLFAGACAARAWLGWAPARIAPDRAQPLLVVTAWGNYGAGAFAILAVTIALAAGALFLGLRATRGRSPQRPGRDLLWLLTFVACSAAACLAWPFVFSSDTYAYAAYGDLAAHGITPYVRAPAEMHDALIDGARWQWSGAFPPCVYGPAFVAFARALVTGFTAASAPASVTLLGFRLTAVAALLATLACAHVALSGCGDRQRARLLAAAGLNPVVVWTVAEGHNDVYALLFIAATAALVRCGAAARSGRVAAFAVYPLGIVVKASAGAIALALALDAVFAEKRPAGRIALATLAGFALAALLVVAPLLPALRGIAGHGTYAPSVSVAGVCGPWGSLAIAIALATVGIATLRRGRRAGHAWLGLALFAAIANPYPWYALTLVPFALAAPRSRAAIALYAVTICMAVRYLPDAFGNMSAGASLAASAVVIAPLLLALPGLQSDLARPSKDRTRSC